MEGIRHSHPIAPQNFIIRLLCDICRREGGPFRGTCYSCPLCDIDI